MSTGSKELLKLQATQCGSSSIRLPRMTKISCGRKNLAVATMVKVMQLLQKGDSTIKERKELLENQREELRQKKALIERSLERLDYKIDHYDRLIAKECKK